MNQAGRRCLQAELLLSLADAQTFRVSIDDERGNALVFLHPTNARQTDRQSIIYRLRVAVRHDQIHAADLRVGNPHFRSVENVVIALFLRRGLQRERIAARRRFRQAEAADLKFKARQCTLALSRTTSGKGTTRDAWRTAAGSAVSALRCRS